MMMRRSLSKKCRRLTANPYMSERSLLSRVRTLLIASLAVLVLAAGSGAAQEHVLPAGYEGDSVAVTSLTVTTSASVQVEPTLATINAAVDATAVTATGAEEEVRQKLGALAALLAERGVTLTTGHFTVYPRWDYVGDTGPVRSGFEARRQIAVAVDEMNRLAEVIQLLLDMGVSEVSGITFGLKDDADARRRAIQKALADAEAQAEAAALAMGRRLWATRSVALQSGVYSYYSGPVAWEGAGAVMPSPATVEVTATVEYLLLPR